MRCRSAQAAGEVLAAEFSMQDSEPASAAARGLPEGGPAGCYPAREASEAGPPHPTLAERHTRSPAPCYADAALDRGGGAAAAADTRSLAAGLPPVPPLDVSGGCAPASLSLTAAASSAAANGRCASPASALPMSLEARETLAGEGFGEGFEGPKPDSAAPAAAQRDLASSPAPNPEPYNMWPKVEEPGGAPAAAAGPPKGAGVAGARLRQLRLAPGEEPDLACHEPAETASPTDASSEPSELRAAHALCTLLNVRMEPSPVREQPSRELPAAGASPAVVPNLAPAPAAPAGTPGGRRSGRNTPVPASPAAAAALLRGEDLFICLKDERWWCMGRAYG